MANTHETLSDLFSGIANAIRSKNGSTEEIVADDFPTEISNLRSGFDYYNHYVTSIMDYQFHDNIDLKNVDCVNISSVGVRAFEGCQNLKTVVLYDAVEFIGENAFKGCDNVTIYCVASDKPEGWNDNWNPDNRPVVWGYAPVKTWNISAMEDDDVTANLYNDARNKGKYLLVINGSGEMCSSGYGWDGEYYKSISSVSIRNGVTSIGFRAFYGCDNLTSIVIPDSVVSIGEKAFYCCHNLTSITIPNGVTSIGEETFYSCDNLTSITIPDSVTSIGKNAFSSCDNLTSIVIPGSVVSIGESAFAYCYGLTSVTIHEGVTSIGASAFYCCRKLTSIVIPDSVTRISNKAFNDTAYYKDDSNWENGVLYIGNHIIATKTTSINGDYVIRDGVVSIGEKAFYDCSSLTSITIPDSVVRIGARAFYGCRSLTSIIIPDGVISIGNEAFSSCSSLASITIPDSVVSIGDSAFAGIAYRKDDSNWENGVLYIGNHVIDANATTINGEYVIRDGVVSIGERAFYGCDNLTSIVIPDSVTSISKGAFTYCDDLTYITIPDGVTSIGDSTFYGCSSLTSITIPDSVTSIGASAFSDCSKLTTVTYSGTVSKWKSITFGSSCFFHVPATEVICSDGTVSL